MSEPFDITKHRLDGDGNPVLKKDGGYAKLTGGKNNPQLVALYFQKSAKNNELSVKVAEGKKPVAKVVDASQVNRSANSIGLFDSNEERMSQVNTDSAELVEMQNRSAQNELISYSTYSRRLEEWVMAEYNLVELMNELESKAGLYGGRVILREDPFDPNVRTVMVTNSFNASVAMNIKQPPTNIVREAENCLKNTRKAMVSESDGHNVGIGFVDDGLRI